MVETKEFIQLQEQLIMYKKAYYGDDLPLISDSVYDQLEQKSFEMAKQLGFRADSWLGPEDNESHHVHWMVGYKEQNRYEEN